jgi:hypothetical protein
MTKWNRKKEVITENLDDRKVIDNISLFKLHHERLNSIESISEKENFEVSSSIPETQDLGVEQLSSLKLKYYEVMKVISKFSTSLDENEKSFATTLVRTLSGNKYSNNDIVLVKRHLVAFLNLLISCFIVYNWYFVMLFTDTNGNRIKTLDLSLSSLKLKNPIFHFFFKYILCVLSMMDRLALIIMPSVISQLSTDRRLQFILVFIMVYFVINNFGTIILNSVDSTVMIGIYVCIFALYELYCVLLDFLPDENGFIDITRLQKYMMFGSVTPLLYLMMFFVRLIWSIILIGISSFLNCVYILVMSFLAIPIYSSSFFGTFKTLNTFVWDSKKVNGGITEVIISIMYRFLYEISFIFILMLGIADYTSNMSTSTQMPTMINCICSAFIFLFAFIAYQRYLINGSLSSYVETITPTNNTDITSNTNDTTIIDTTRNNIIDTSNIPTNDKFNSITSKLIDSGVDKIKNGVLNSVKSKYGKMIPTNLLSSIPSNDTSKLIDSGVDKIKNGVLNSVKKSKYGKMIPTNLLSSIV